MCVCVCVWHTSTLRSSGTLRQNTDGSDYAAPGRRNCRANFASHNPPPLCALISPSPLLSNTTTITLPPTVHFHSRFWPNNAPVCSPKSSPLPLHPTLPLAPLLQRCRGQSCKFLQRSRQGGFCRNAEPRWRTQQVVWGVPNTQPPVIFKTSVPHDWPQSGGLESSRRAWLIQNAWKPNCYHGRPEALLFLRGWEVAPTREFDCRDHCCLFRGGFHLVWQSETERDCSTENNWSPGARHGQWERGLWWQIVGLSCLGGSLKGRAC